MTTLLYFSVLLVIGCVAASPILPSGLSDIEVLETLSKSSENFRLPNNTKPLEYDIHITTKVHENKFDFTGVVNIKLQALETKSNSEIVVHARQLSDFKAEFYYENGTSATDIDTRYDKDKEFLTVYSTKNKLHLVNGTVYRLKISYKGKLREDNGGFYKSSYLNSKGTRIYLATTQFESTDARHGFPCYDEPGLKAKFTVSLTHGKNYTAISNMPKHNGVNTLDDSNMVTTKFKTTPLMSTYLVAFVVSDFDYSSQIDSKKREERVYSRPGSKSEQEFALKTSVKILSGLEEYLKVNYSLPKMDQIAVPDFAAGAMENWGLVTYREEYLLYNPKNSTVYTETNIASIIAHEYAHQWFGNLVSPKWWTYIWLNEGFASLFSYIATDKVYPEWDFMEYFIVAEYQRALGADIGNSARPMTHYVQTPKEIVSLFDSISYSKAACVLRMIQHVITEKVFAEGLNNYLREMEFKAAEEDDLFKGLQTAVDKNKIKLPAKLQVIMKSWTNQGGFPLLKVTRNYDTGTFTIEQQTFHEDPNIKDKKLWWVPYNFVTSNDPKFNSTKFEGFLEGKKSITVEPTASKTWTKYDWLILNVQQTGYYRVNYDEENWNLIIKALNKDPSVIHTFNKAQLINDAFRLVITKRLPIKTLFSLLSYLKMEGSYSPWVAASGTLNTFNLFMRGDNDTHYFDFFIGSIVENLYKKLGIKEQDKEHHFTKYTRTTAIKWACEASVKDCLETTNARLRDFVKNGTAIEPNLQEVIYCYGLKKATDEEFSFLHKRLMQSVDAAERQLLISSLGCSVNSKQLELFLGSSISKAQNNTLRPQERIVLLRSAYSKSQEGFFAAVNFLSKNYEKYAELTPGFSKQNPLVDDIIKMSALVVTGEQKTKFEELLSTAGKHEQVNEKVKATIAANIQTNLDWIKTHRGDVLDWLKVYEKNNRSSATAISVVPVLVLIGSILRFLI